MTGFTFTEILGLTGIFGLEKKIPNKSIKQLTFDTDNRVVKIELSTIHVKKLSVNIYLGKNFIHNNLVVSNKKRKGIALALLSSQVKYASYWRFKYLELYAYGNREKDKDCNGYYTWGKLGYCLTDFYRRRFLKEMKKYNRPETTLYSLLLSEEGRKLWREIGFEWEGRFFLADSSRNMKRLVSILDNR